MNRFPFAVCLVVLASCAALGQESFSLTDGSTPPGLAPGAPVGAFALSDFDRVNLFNGNLNVALPLLKIGGRGNVGYAAMLVKEQRWRVISQRVWDQQLGDYKYIYIPDPNSWNGPRPGFGPGVLIGRRAGSNPGKYCSIYPTEEDYQYTLTRLTFITADGTEFELRDETLNGDAAAVGMCPPADGASRGTVFVTKDGTAATFVSADEIRDNNRVMTSGADYFYPSGYLMLRDGTRYQIEDGSVKWMRDRNGNMLTFAYDTNPPNSRSIVSATDTNGRTVQFSDTQISYPGYQGTARTITLTTLPLNNVTPSPFYEPDSQGFQSPQTPADLFPDLDGSSQNPFNPNVLHSINLPNGTAYKFYYNAYGEVSKVELPAGGRIEYTWGCGVAAGDCTYSRADTTRGPNVDIKMIYRRVKERRAYADLVTTTASSYTKFVSADFGNLGIVDNSVTAEHYAAAPSLLQKEVHYFYGTSYDSLSVLPTGYAGWKQSREFKTEIFDNLPSLRLMKTSEETWEQAAPNGTGDRPNDPHVSQSVTTLDDGQKAKQTYLYDSFVNRTDVYEYGYGQGAPGALLRHQHTQYQTASAYADVPVHIRNLPLEQTVLDAADNLAARTSYDYDVYTAGLVARSGITGHCSTTTQQPACEATYGTATTTRGNVTAVRRLIAPGGSEVSTLQAYDIAGNLTAATDAKGNTTDLGYDNNCANGPTNTFAFLTSVTLPAASQGAQRFTSTRRYDCDLGKIVKFTDINTFDTTYAYNDPLDRLTAVVRAATQTNAQSQTRFTYDDTGRTITTNSDLTNYQDDALKAASVYDGLGRTIESRQYESGTDYIATQTVYDAMGRVSQVSNPYRVPSDSEDPGAPHWTTTQYDALGRVISVTSPDGAVATTGYQGNVTTVRDQATKTRQLTTDAPGRLTAVVEDPSGVAYSTAYTYDALDNLTDVAQGVQARHFTYDSLKRLLTATNPESGQVTYQYDANGNVLSKADARVTKTYTAYDGLNRVSSFSYSDGTPSVSYSYDTASNGKGKLAAVVNSASTYQYLGYDQLGRVTQTSQQMGSLTYGPMTYGYNRAGSPAWETYPSGRTVLFDYDQAGRAKTLSAVGGVTYATLDDAEAAHAYWVNGGIHKMKLGAVNPATQLNYWEHTNYNLRLQPVEIGWGNSAADSSLRRFQYGYGTTNNNGNVLSQTISAAGFTATQSYTYDGVNRLETSLEGIRRRNHGYDQYGNNWVSLNENLPLSASTPVAQSWFNAANNRIVGYAYEPSGTGNLTGANGWTYSYDGENRLKQAETTVNGTTYTNTYQYDGEGRRVKKTVGAVNTVYVYDAMGQMIAEYTDASTEQTAATEYVLADHLGSTRAVLDALTNTLSCHDYLPFGEDLTAGRESAACYNNTDAVKQKFTGKERDVETGLDYFIARYYSGQPGRWTTPEPLVANRKLEDPQLWNKYAYVANRPLTYVDPDGKWPWWIHNAIIDATLERSLTYQERRVLKLASAYTDRSENQDAAHSYQHGMSRPGQAPAEAILETLGFISSEIEKAVTAQLAAEKNRPELFTAEVEGVFWFSKDYAFGTLFHLGQAIHAASDSYSPEHVGAQVWSGRESLPQKVGHFFGESNPFDHDELRYEANLAVTRTFLQFRSRLEQEREKQKRKKDEQGHN